MSELYRAIAGSPITYLSSDISAAQTTISIADDSALPDAPNICTIGYGEELETIKYGAKSNGVLQNVTRGIEGTPRAWPAGTEVARFFTAYDHNSIIENFNSHLADIANSGMQTVTQTAVTGNVQYGKSYGTGVVCIGHSTLTSELETPYGAVSIFTLPAGFRPIAEVWVPIQFDNNWAAAVMRVYPSGLVQIASRQGDPIPTSIAFRASIVFPIA